MYELASGVYKVKWTWRDNWELIEILALPLNWLWGCGQLASLRLKFLWKRNKYISTTLRMEWNIRTSFIKYKYCAPEMSMTLAQPSSVWERLEMPYFRHPFSQAVLWQALGSTVPFDLFIPVFFFALEQDVFSQDEERKVSQSCWIQMEMGTREGVVIGEERKPWCFCSGRPNWASPAITWHCCFLSTGSARNHRATVDCTAFANKRMKPLKDEFQLANLHRFFVV